MNRVSSLARRGAVAAAILSLLALSNLGWSLLDQPKQDCTAYGTAHGDYADVWEIYAAAIEKYYIAGAKEPMTVIIVDPYKGKKNLPCPKGTEDSCRKQIEDNAELREKLPGLSYETLKDYRSQCVLVGRPIDKPLKLSKPYVVLGEDELPKAKPGDFDSYWRELREKYPGSSGVISFDPPGFDAKSTQALLRMEKSAGLMSVRCYFLLLEKKDGHWQVTREYLYLMT